MSEEANVDSLPPPMRDAANAKESTLNSPQVPTVKSGGAKTNSLSAPAVESFDEAKTNPSSTPVTTSKIQELQKAMVGLRDQLLDEKRRIKKERTNRKERTHALSVLGAIIERHGKERIAQILAGTQWLKSEDRLAVEYYFEIRPRPTAKKEKEAANK